MIISNAKNNEYVKFDVAEIESDRAEGVSLHLHIKKKNINAKFFYVWVSRGLLTRFAEDIGKILTGAIDRTEINTITHDGIRIEIKYTEEKYLTGIEIIVPNLLDIDIKDSASLGFEAAKESLETFNKKLLNVTNSFYSQM